jgi:uncharacterized membrane protein YsdA (DUF1294 family)/cold shock CspA family protein
MPELGRRRMAMARQGRLTEWNDERGFGFITPLDGSSRVFVHISQFPPAGRRPTVLDLLAFSVETDDRGRPRASDVAYLVPARARSVEPAKSPRMQNALVVSGLFLVLITTLAAAGALPLEVPAAYVILSAVSFVAYALDKSAARRGARRTPEATLHLLALGGGWPGALLAQQALHHKTIKQPFRRLFWATVVGNCLLLAVFLIAGGGAIRS